MRPRVVGRLAPFLLVAACAVPLGCREPPPPLVKSCEFGVFYGGQVQEREELPFELDRGKQTQGLRVEFSRPLTREVSVSWEIGKPNRRARAKGEPARVVELGEGRAATGATRFEQVVAFTPDDALGSWSLRVVVDGEPVLVRSFRVYDAASRTGDARRAAASASAAAPPAPQR